MTSKTPNNPLLLDGTQITSQITLRDLFAAASLRGAALLTVVDAKAVARDAYRIADAMLRERAK